MEKLAKQILTFRRASNWSRPTDLLAKVVSLLFAVLLWYFVSGEDRVDMSVEIPVEIINLPRNLVISNQFKNKLDVTVSGPRSLIKEIDSQDVSRSIDLSEATPGSMVISNDLDSITFPRGIKTLRIQPASITLLLDQLIQKDIPIEHTTTGKLAEKLVLNSITLEPNHLVISGPSNTFGNIDSLKTVPIDLTGIEKTVTIQTPLDLTTEQASLTGESVVSATITVKERLLEKTIKNIPIKAIRLPEEFYAKPTPSSVTAKAHIPYSLAKKTKDLTSLFSAQIDTTGLATGSHTLRVQLTAPPNLKNVSSTPASVSVEIWEKKKKKKFH